MMLRLEETTIARSSPRRMNKNLHHHRRRDNTKLLAMMIGVLSFTFSSLVTGNAAAFSTIQHYRHLSIGAKFTRTSSPNSSKLIHTHHPERGGSASSSMGLEKSEERDTSYQVQVIHQGYKTTINVHRDEPILQALERQSTIAAGGDQISLALSHIPHECRRGNCLTCASKFATANSNQRNGNLIANVDNGLSPTIAEELSKSGYVLTCCSYVTGPGVILELDQHNEVWDAVYRQRLCDGDTKQVAMEAQARLLRRVDEENVGRWRNKMEKVWGEGDM